MGIVKTLLTLIVSMLWLVNASSVCGQFRSAHDLAAQSQSQSSAENIPTVDFCEIVRNPRRYFNKTLRVQAMWQQGFEFSYLNYDHCATKFRYEIAAGFVENRESKNVATLMSREYGGRAIITAVGRLLNPGGRYHGYYRYWFQIDRLEEVDRVVVPYQGTLDDARTYRASVRGDKDFGLSLVPSLIIPNAHFATRIEWVNLSEFPALEKLRETSGELQIVFTVISVNTKQMTAQRWNRDVQCKIIRLE